MTHRVLTVAEQVLSRGLEAAGEPLSLAQARALAAFAAVGLPSRKQEYWHYTDLRVLLREVPEGILSPKGGLRSRLLIDAPTIGLVNGQALVKNLPDFVLPLRQQFEAGDEGALPKWRDGDIVAQLNAAYVRDGFRLDLTQDFQLEIQNIVEAGQAHIHLPIQIAAGKKGVIVLREIGDDLLSFRTTMARLELAERAEVTFVILRQCGKLASELSQFNACLHEGAKLNLFVINAGGKLIRQEVNVNVIGKGADFQLRGVNLLNGRSHTDITMDVQHLAAGTTSSEIIRNVVMDKARGVFQGMIRVAQPAQKTDAKMTCNSLILSDEAEFYAKPELEIFADDVACGHGATVVDINPDHMFYLMARGISRLQARGLLVKAFVDELIEDLENQELQRSIKNIVDQWLDKNN